MKIGSAPSLVKPQVHSFIVRCVHDAFPPEIRTSLFVSKKELDSAWQVLRLALRTATLEYAERHLPRVSALSGQPVDPEQVAKLASQIESELEKISGQGQASPVLRALQKTFRPNRAEKERRRLEKAFNTYLEAWNSQKKS